MNTAAQAPVTATITEINRQTPRGWFDTVTVTNEDGEELAVVMVESSEFEDPYDDAVREAGFPEFTWAEQSL